MNKLLQKNFVYLDQINKQKGVKIKIFGERNTGTNFLKLLLKRNIKNVNVLDGRYCKGSGWKHGFPKSELLNKLKGPVIYIYTERELESWLNSMYRKPYHINWYNNFDNFIKKKIIKDTRNKRLDELSYVSAETSYNLIQLRYLKRASLINFLDQRDNVVFLNLGWLQKNYRKFINNFCRVYGLKKKWEVVKAIKKHTKTKEVFGRNTRKDIKFSVSKKISDEFVNKDVECKINKLTCIIKKKNDIQRL